MRIAAHLFSIVFHPLLILTYITLVLLWTNPYAFGWRSASEADTLLIILVMTSIVLPALAVVMMKGLGWVQSLQLESRHERIGPYIVAGIMYLSLYLHVTHAGTFPVSLRIAILGTLFALWISFFINNFSKVSVHAAGVGGLVAMMLLTKFYYAYDPARIPLPGDHFFFVSVNSMVFISVLIAGAVCTSRIILQAHVNREVYQGFLIGLVSIWTAHWLLQ